MSTERRITGLRPKTSDVSRLLRANREQQAPALHAVTETQEPEPATHGVTESQTPETPSMQAVDPGHGGTAMSTAPKYLRLRRREARIHHDQADELTRLTRRLNDARRQPDGSTVGERITDNTLLRVAVDLLLARAGDLHGVTEAELARSVGLTPRNEN